MCNIWQKGIAEEEMTVDEFKSLFSKKEYSEVEDLSISGGEALLREDILEVIEAITSNMRKLHMFFLCTNGTNPEKARDVIKKMSEKIKDVYLCVSIEGSREVHESIRGIDSYDQALKTIRICREAAPKIHVSISMTLTSKNCNLKSLMHIKRIAEETHSDFSFREVWVNDTYYKNVEADPRISSKQRALALNFIEKYCMKDPFMRVQAEYFRSGKIPLMGDKKNGVLCNAGSIFTLVRPDGTIYPCINSSRIIGDKNRGIFVKEINDLGTKEQCPCCTECCVWPVISWSKYAT